MKNLTRLFLALFVLTILLQATGCFRNRTCEDTRYRQDDCDRY